MSTAQVTAPATAAAEVTAVSAAPASPVTWPSDSIALTLRRMAAVLGATWLAVDLYGVASTGSAGFRLPWLALTCLAIGIAGCVLVGVSRRVPGRVMVGAVAVAMVADLLLADPSPEHGDGFVVYWLPGLLAVTASLLAAERTALRVCALTAAASATVVLATEVPAGGWSVALTSATASACITVCDGLAALLLARALRGVAAAADAAMTDVEAERELQARTRAETETARRLAVGLHDTVINTLAAVVARDDTLDRAAVRQHCDEGADVADRLLAGSAALDEVRHALAWDENPGPLRPAVRLVGCDRAELFVLLVALPPSVSSAMAGALRELLLNVRKHSGTDRAQVEVDNGDVLRIVVRDSGVGFDGTVVAGRGLQRSVLDRCAAAGVRVDLDTAPGAGTAVTLEFDRSTTDDGEEQVRRDRDRLLASVGTPFARQLSYCLFALCACMTVVVAPTQNSAFSWAALGLLGLVTWVGARRADAAGRLGASWATVIVLLIPLIVFLPAANLPGCQRFGTAWWGTDGALIPFVCLVFLVRRWWWLALGALAFVAGVTAVTLSGSATGCRVDAPTSGVLDAVVVLAFAFFRIQLSRLATRASAEAARGRALRTSGATEWSAVRVRFAEVFVALESASGLLRSIADGVLDPRDPAVRERCALMEGHLRRLTQLDPGLRTLGPQLSRALARAHDTGVRLVLRVGSTDTPDAEVAGAVGALLGAVLDRCSRGDEVTVAMLDADAGGRLSVVAPASCLPVPDDVLRRAGEVGWDVDAGDLGEQCLIELHRKGGPWTTPAPATAAR